jgi:hypothetical protein
VSQLAGPVAPNAIGEFLIRNLQTGRHRVIAQLPDENWYVRAISMEGKPTAPPARKTPTRVITDVARDGVTLKPGEKLAGMTVTIATGAAAVKGRVVAEQDGKLSGKVRAYLIPAEKEAAEDTLRYAQANASPDGDFNFKNLAPGSYYLLAKVVKDGADAKAPSHFKAWDAAARATLRREAEATGKALELQNCQRVEDYKLTIQGK